MRRVLRIVLDVVTGLSLVLCVASIVFWTLSYSHLRTALRNTTSTSLIVAISRGERAVEGERIILDRDATLEWGHADWNCGKSPATDILADIMTAFSGARHPVAGFFFGHNVNAGVGSTIVILPMPFVVALLAAPLFLMVRSSLRRCRRVNHIAERCPICGYDLRATPDRCPECGTIPIR